jgi:hypothetical protein
MGNMGYNQALRMDTLLHLDNHLFALQAMGNMGYNQALRMDVLLTLMAVCLPCRRWASWCTSRRCAWTRSAHPDNHLLALQAMGNMGYKQALRMDTQCSR